MKLRAKISSLTETAKRHPGNTVLSLAVLFFLNILVLIFTVANFPRNDGLIITVLALLNTKIFCYSEFVYSYSADCYMALSGF
jgi:hypothetical protein